jgi:hypothetical protein
VIAAERPAADGFSPVGFYVPDWWDLHDGTTLPGSMSWRPADHEWPAGDFGFVWGCIWGDDASWKVQYLDLSDVAAGEIRRDDRFGYAQLAADPKLEPADFIRCSSHQGQRRVEFYLRRRSRTRTGEGQRPRRQRGLRFSRKAVMPSCASGSWLVAAITSTA